MRFINIVTVQLVIFDRVRETALLVRPRVRAGKPKSAINQKRPRETINPFFWCIANGSSESDYARP